MRSEGFYVNEKSNDTSWDRTSDLPICNTAPYRGPLITRDSSVDIVNWLRIREHRNRVYITAKRNKILSTTASRPVLEPSRTLILYALSPGVKRSGRQSDSSLSRNTEVGNACSPTSTPPYAFKSSWVKMIRSKLIFSGILNMISSN